MAVAWRVVDDGGAFATALDGDAVHAAAAETVRDDRRVRFPLERAGMLGLVRAVAEGAAMSQPLFVGHGHVAVFVRRSIAGATRVGDGNTTDDAVAAHVVVPALTQAGAIVDVAAMGQLIALADAAATTATSAPTGVPKARVYLSIVDAGGSVNHLQVQAEEPEEPLPRRRAGGKSLVSSNDP